MAMIDDVKNALGATGTYQDATIQAYIDEVKAHDKMNSPAWDELERSIMAKLADDVTVKTIGREVELIVTKIY